jgi:hypothetical protein
MRANPREMADEPLEVRSFDCSRFQNATGENVLVTFSDTMTLYVHSGNDKSDLAAHYERHSRSSAPTRSVGHYVQRFCTRIRILISNS